MAVRLMRACGLLTYLQMHGVLSRHFVSSIGECSLVYRLHIAERVLGEESGIWRLDTRNDSICSCLRFLHRLSSGDEDDCRDDEDNCRDGNIANKHDAHRRRPPSGASDER